MLRFNNGCDDEAHAFHGWQRVNYEMMVEIKLFLIFLVPKKIIFKKKMQADQDIWLGFELKKFFPFFAKLIKNKDKS